MLKCPKCDSEITISKFEDTMLEVSCSCQKPRYFTDTGNDEEAKIRFIDKILGKNKPGSSPQPAPDFNFKRTGIPQKIREIKNRIKESVRVDFKKNNEITKHFPSNFTPREIQVQLWNEIQSKFAEGFRIIVLSAPTGVGKSLLAASIAKQFGSSFIVTSTKSLQDQYASDIAEFYPVKGKTNFACFKIMEQKKIPFDDTYSALQKRFTCNVGNCTETVLVDGIEKEEICKFKPSIEDVQNNSTDAHSCLYYLQKYRGLVSAHSIWNYASYFQILEQEKQFSEFLNRSVAIFDEAHKIEDQIIQFIGIKIDKDQVEECKLKISAYDLSDIDKIIMLLDDISNSYAKQIKSLKDNNSDLETIGQIEEKYDRVMNSIQWVSGNKENFVINEPFMNFNGEFVSISIQPLNISEYVKRYFQNEHQIFMSATIDKESFCENLGFDPNTVAFIDTPKSPFSVESREINFENIAYLNYKSPDEDKLAVITRIDEIMSMNSTNRGIIFTSSKKRCFDILENLTPENKSRIRIWHSSDSKGETMEKLLLKHESSANGVLLSSSLWEGIDLKDDLSRFQIIEKTPYADMSDKRIKMKMKIAPAWYSTMTMIKLLQGFGRSIRNENDWAKTYVLDSAAYSLLSKMRNKVPKAYHDVIGLE